ncbi:hypothetical protein VPH35_066140 [Triticum aestivum]
MVAHSPMISPQPLTPSLQTRRRPTPPSRRRHEPCNPPRRRGTPRPHHLRDLAATTTATPVRHQGNPHLYQRPDPLQLMPPHPSLDRVAAAILLGSRHHILA